VRPYVVRNKTNRTYAKALLEATRNDEVRPVPVKSETQQALAALHRCAPRGWPHAPRASTQCAACCASSGSSSLSARAPSCRPSGRSKTTTSVCPACSAPPSPSAAREIRELERRIRTVEHQLDAVAEQTPVVSRLCSIPGVGLLTATALVAAVGDVQRFPSARHFASYLGLTPRERSTGQRRQLGAISKRGDAYLRMLLIHGARAVLCHAKTKTTSSRASPGQCGSTTPTSPRPRPPERKGARGEPELTKGCFEDDDMTAHRL